MLAELEAVGYTAAYLEDLNTVFRNIHIRPMGAYSVGVVESIIRNATGEMPPASVLFQASECSSIEGAVKVAENWLQRLREAAC